MTLDDAEKVAAIASSLGGLCGGLVAWLMNLWWKVREKADTIRVRIGAATPVIEQETMMHVVSRSDHPMMLADYGFIVEPGKLYSLPYALEAADGGEQFELRGTKDLAGRNSKLEAGQVLDNDIVVLGAYAKTTAQDRVRLVFEDDVGWLRRLRLRMRLTLRPYG